jgi:aminoglycoside N3'-acetyltransferase
MRKVRNYEEINKRCELLMQYGFDVHHEDTSVYLEMSDYREIDFDFKRVDIKDFVTYAVKRAYDEGKRVGRNEFADDFQKLLSTRD